MLFRKLRLDWRYLWVLGLAGEEQF